MPSFTWPYFLIYKRRNTEYIVAVQIFSNTHTWEHECESCNLMKGGNFNEQKDKNMPSDSIITGQTQTISFIVPSLIFPHI